jgi:ribosomal protein L20A (L18A)
MITLKILATQALLFGTLVVYAKDSTQTIEKNSNDITAQNVIDNYLVAIGGKNLFKSVEDRVTFIKGNVDGQTLKIIIEQKTPNKLKQIISTEKIKQIILYNGQKGIWLVEDKQIPIEGADLAKLKLDAEMKFLLHPDLSGVEIGFDRVEMSDSINCHKLKLTTVEGFLWHQFYSIRSGLKIKEVKEVKTEHGNFIQETFFYDYKEVEGLKFPFVIRQTLGSQTIEMIVDSIKLNRGLNDNIFEIPD